MNRLFTILCMVSMLVFHTSCNESVMDLESPNVEIKTRAAEQRVQNLIQQARQGDVEACKSLSICYRDGDGVVLDRRAVFFLSDGLGLDGLALGGNTDAV